MCSSYKCINGFIFVHERTLIFLTAEVKTLSNAAGLIGILKWLLSKVTVIFLYIYI